MIDVSRRSFLETLAAGMAWPFLAAPGGSRARQFRIRTVTTDPLQRAK
jgi:hypothetical protein